MDSKCLQCSEPVKTLKFMKCQGFCEKVAHIECVSLSRPNMDFINEQPNLFWFCNSCSGIMNSKPIRDAFAALTDAFRNLSETHRSAMEGVKTELAKNREQVEVLASKISAVPATAPAAPATSVPPIGWSHVTRKTNKRTFGAAGLTSPDVPSLSCGTKKLSANIASISTVPPEPEKCWVFLSRIAASASEDDILALATECIPCDEPIEVRKLVKKDADLSSMRFISFKIGVDEKYREVALSAETWPDGVFFREFINYEDRKSGQGFPKTPRLN